MKQNTTTTEQGLQSDTQLNVENNHNNNSTLIDYKEIEGTPFTMVRKEDKYFLIMGDYRMTEPTNTEEETMEKIEKEKWLLIFHIAATVIEKMSIIKIRQLLEGNRKETMEGITENSIMSIADKYNRMNKPVDDNVTP